MPEYEPKALFDKALYEVVNVTDVSRFGTKQTPRGQELLAIDQRTSIEYRQEDGSLFHRYGLPRQYSTVQLKHYFHYLQIKDIYKLPVGSLKADFIANIAQ
ncbi:MAG: hypothetical protein P8N43_07295, partial [Alphaproteobacteria bacterium]|nr:hypothetical protein [Alphaproteobacteria bacterium]